MIVKQIWTESSVIHWWECDYILYVPERIDKPSEVKLYRSEALIRTIEFSKDRNCNFKLYFLESGKTIDTLTHKNKV